MTRLCFFLLALPAFAAVDGVVTNQTTGKPQAGVTLTLIRLGQGMENIASTKSDAQGHFHIDKDLDRAAPHLLQAIFDKVTYNKAIPPGGSGSGLQIDVYNATSKKGAAKVTQHMILLQPTSSALGVNESIIFDNQGKTTYDDPANGTFRFFLPEEAKGQVKVVINGPQGMPIQRPAVKTSDPNVFKVEYPVKPGETRFDLAYAVPSTKEFAGKILHGGGPVRLVAPKGVDVQGETLKKLGVEPQTQASIFEVSGTSYAVHIEGTGSLHPADSAAAAQQQQQQEDQGPPIEESKPRVYQRLPWMLTCAGLILAIGFALLYRADNTAQARRK
jgi:hypothetical protein